MPDENYSSNIKENKFSKVEKLIDDIHKGKIIIIVDDEDRENEGDLICSASKITPEIVNFMVTHGKGLICVPMTDQYGDRLKLPLMSNNNTEFQKTNFTISVDAKNGITTGISAEDRSKTIKVIANPSSTSKDISTPGHIFPLRSVNGGVLRRAGHTEAAVDLASMAKLPPVGVICEILKEDGKMARLPDLFNFSKKHNLSIGTIQSLIEYRRNKEKLINKIEQIKLPTDFGDFDLILYENSLNPAEQHIALVKGKINPKKPVLVRVHSECLTGDVFTSRRCDCGSQLDSALSQINEEGVGVLVYMRQEGRGIGLANKIRAYKFQEKGLDTVEANHKLGFKSDLRNYGMGAQILHDLGVRKIKLLTNNPKKIIALEGHNLSIVERIPIKIKPNNNNKDYLNTKRDKLDHLL